MANKNRCNRTNRLAFVLGTLGVAAATAFTVTMPLAQARIGEGVHPVIIPGFKYMGNATCAGSGCHSEAEPTEQSGQWVGDENNIWAQWDPHAQAYKTLSNDDSAAIAQKLNIAADSDRCLACHATPAPEPQRGDLFSFADDAVSCESCHGPSEAWLDPHAEAGWTPEKREEIGADGLLDDFGLADTHRIDIRANTCVACHLQIDKDMIDAGHPPLEFELYAYNYYVSKKAGAEYYRHWDEAPNTRVDARLWATGQAAALNAATAQLAAWKAKGWDTAQATALVELYQRGTNIASKHFGADTTEGLAEAEYTAENTAAAALDLAKLAPTASNAIESRVIGFGVTALGSASFEAQGRQAPDAFWTHYQTAISGQTDDAYAAAVQQMAELIQP